MLNTAVNVKFEKPRLSVVYCSSKPENLKHSFYVQSESHFKLVSVSKKPAIFMPPTDEDLGVNSI